MRPIMLGRLRRSRCVYWLGVRATNCRFRRSSTLLRARTSNCNWFGVYGSPGEIRTHQGLRPVHCLADGYYLTVLRSVSHGTNYADCSKFLSIALTLDSKLGSERFRLGPGDRDDPNRSAS